MTRVWTWAVPCVWCVKECLGRNLAPGAFRHKLCKQQGGSAFPWDFSTALWRLALQGWVSARGGLPASSFSWKPDKGFVCTCFPPEHSEMRHH